ncbi:molybdopterin-dependent oxidoreductase [Halolamina salifodinae]|uniref:DMSO/TMAO reductase YedYZ molybdopterin-dependent catalytic subunit n=1 Tax=Halolamina salifodinae TaxID=1202767 RepID=A0A8T4GW42_9EURY|nr:molybdopterin-dependent oxidoreductase [Halolamina salifodinae]MBP1986283.1 DMSO/TMAO reductase YedYZ molybdopterin-dependent catalytic subunit [Halolamina salifodinae]
MNRRVRDIVDPASLGVALLAALGAVGGSLLLIGNSPGFVVPSAAALVRDTLPDLFVAVGIGTLRDLAQPLLSLGAGLLLLAVFAAAALAAERAVEGIARRALVTFVLVGAVTALLTGNTTSTLGAALGAAVVVAAANATLAAMDPTTDRADPPPGRRRLLQAGAATLATLVLGAARTRDPAEPTEPPDPAAASLLAAANDRGLSLPGAEPMVSEDFYTVDIATVDPKIDPSDWQLAVTGEVETERSFTLSELQDLGGERRFTTLRCVSDLLNGKKMDTALWDGVPVESVLSAVGAPESCCVTLHAADDYFVSFPREALDPGLLAWGMNGRPLPRSHGAPLRTLVPGHWGETNAKWLTEIEIRDEPEEGYWEQRGWEGTGEVHTIAKLHSTTVDDGTVRVGGHAYAGTRGIDAVEVSTDGGASWTEASLSETLPEPTPIGEEEPEPTGEAADAWRMWEHEYEADGKHEVVVRAIDGTGEAQPEQEREGYPSGATGWVRETVGG